MTPDVSRRRTVWVGCLACVVLALALATPAPGVAAGGGPDLAAIDRAVARSFAATRLPGMALAITRGQDVLLVKGYGSAGGGRPVTPRTQFRVASLSKSFTALAVLQLAEAGRVDLDAPVRRYLTDFTVADPDAADRITVRNLLSQTSGLADAGFDVNGPQPATAGARVASLRTARPVAEPGREFHYFDPNYQILARLVEIVAGTPFEEYLDRQVLTPLGMTGTVGVATTQDAGRAAPGLAQGHVLFFGQPVARDELAGFVAGSGGVVSTAEDMARWLIVHNSGGRVADRRVLSAEGIRTLHTPPAGLDSDYAMGWLVADPAGGPRRLEHTGVLSTFSADQVLLPDGGYGVALLYDGNYALADTAGIRTRVVALLTGGPPDGNSFPRTAVVAAVLGALTVGTVALRVRALLRLRGWADRRRSTSWWRLVGGLGWLLLPAALVTALPAVTLRLIGRAFTYRQLALSMPDVLSWLGVGAVTGAALATARVTALVRLRRHGSPPAPGGAAAGAPSQDAP